MTRAQAAKILARLQRAMLLRDWKPWLDRESPAPDGISAQVFRRDDYFDARIRIGDRLLEQGSEWHVTQSLAHELMHLVLRDLEAAHRRIVYSDYIPQSARAAFLSSWDHEEEKVVDQVARAITNLLLDGDEPDDHFPGHRDEDDE